MPDRRRVGYGGSQARRIDVEPREQQMRANVEASLQRIGKRVRGRTLGDWRAIPQSQEQKLDGEAMVAMVDHNSDGLFYIATLHTGHNAAADAEFFAHAPDDIEYLLGMIVGLRMMLDKAGIKS
jgi:hypothetical protein